MKYTINYANGASETKALNTDNNTYAIKRTDEDFDKISSIDVLLAENISAGDEGFYILPGAYWRAELRAAGMGYYKEHIDCDYINYDPHMPVFCINHCGESRMYIAEGMKETASQRVVVKDNKYSLYMHFEIEEEIPYDDITVAEYKLSDGAGYNEFAKKYRAYCFENGYVRLKDRLNSELEYAAESVMVRIRMGWKPVPCRILEQTEENEPPMHVACTFKDVENLMYEYKKAGIQKAEFCLVGWNKGGHDGRWPQAFPVEEKLGGEKDLIALIETAHRLGYNICCHTNSTDGYTLANNFTEDDIALKKDGTKSIGAEMWGGGRMYDVCPKRALDFAKEDFPKIAKLGFRGTHYIDVITATPPRRCYNKNHPVNYKEGVEYMDAILELARKLFGAVGSECAITHNMKHCDFVLYNTFRKHIGYKRQEDELDLIDEYIPFWEIVFHGTVLYTTNAVTVNAAFSKDKDAMLRLIEYGARPTIYYYSKFKSDGTDWIGDEDFTFDTPQRMEKSVIGTKQTEDFYNQYSYLQYELIEKHEKISENVFATTYSDGTVVTVDYNEKKYDIKRG